MQLDIHSKNNLNREGSNEKGLLAIKGDEHTGDTPMPPSILIHNSKQSYKNGLISIKGDEHIDSLIAARYSYSQQ